MMPKTVPVRRVITTDDEYLAGRCALGRIVVIDDDPEILLAMRALFELEGYAVETHSSAQSYLLGLEPMPPQFPGPFCLLCDVKMPGLSGLELQQRLKEMGDAPLVLMSGVSGVHEAASAFRAGALDFLVKPVDAEVLLAVVHKALEVSSRRQQERNRSSDLQERVKALTSRERDVVRLVVTGQTNQVIADTLEIALRTVKLHRQRAMEKLGALTTVDLVRIVDQIGL